jgi:hypothetical protein
MSASLPKTSPFAWNKAREEAAILLADNDLSDEAIAQRVGVSRRTLTTWKQHPDFAARVGDHVGQIQVAMLRLAIAKKHKRLEVLDTMHTKLLNVIEERSVEYEDEAPGTRTGLVTKTYKMIGTGRDATMVTEWGVDTPTLRELRALEEQAAKELGQWVEKSQVEDLTRIVEIVGVESDAI